eukprot:scaffold21420_cov129-Isochrysis_galbana.AAC.3
MPHLERGSLLTWGTCRRTFVTRQIAHGQLESVKILCVLRLGDESRGGRGEPHLLISRQAWLQRLCSPPMAGCAVQCFTFAAVLTAGAALFCTRPHALALAARTFQAVRARPSPAQTLG